MPRGKWSRSFVHANAAAAGRAIEAAKLRNAEEAQHDEFCEATPYGCGCLQRRISAVEKVEGE
jgi:hypothetical protein